MAEILYFEEPGPQNTIPTLEMALKRAKELNIKDIVVASTTGETGLLAAKIFQGYNLVVVTHSTGFRKPDFQELTEENRRAIEALGGKILTCTHAFGGIGRAVRRKLNTYQLEEIIAFTLRLFGEGMKVAIEITLMAVDAGLIRTDREAIAIAGTGRGADTAIVVLPANTQSFFDLRILEIIAKPRLH